MMNMNVDEHFALLFEHSSFAVNRILEVSTSIVEYNSQLNYLLLITYRTISFFFEFLMSS
jgi:hypothetical protein